MKVERSGARGGGAEEEEEEEEKEEEEERRERERRLSSSLFLSLPLSLRSWVCVIAERPLRRRSSASSGYPKAPASDS
jgi:hypothetical protein